MNVLLYVSDEESDSFKAEVADIPSAQLIQSNFSDGSMHDYIVYGLQLTTATINIVYTILSTRAKSSKTHLKTRKETINKETVTNDKLTTILHDDKQNDV